MVTIHIIGIGLDGVAGLGDSIRNIVNLAALLAGSERHLSYFPQHPAPKIVLRDLTEMVVEIQQRLAAWQQQITPYDSEELDIERFSSLIQSPSATQQYHIAILVSGDPLFFGLGRLLLSWFPPEDLVFHPHVSSIQLAFNRIKVPWQDAVIVSGHGRSLERLNQALQQNAEKIAILTDNINTPAAIANLLLSLDLPSLYQFWVCENLGGTEEKVESFLLNQVSSQTFAALNVVILIRQSADFKAALDLSKIPCSGIPDQYFLSFSDRPGLMTKREVRSLVLGELELQPNQIIWDIGAGTGSVSIEMARLFPESTIYSVEKTAAGTTLIEQNIYRFQVNNVISIHGEAPDILHRLRSPHRIFIGGSGGQISEILGLCSLRLIAGGIIVIALATLEHLSTVLDWVKQRQTVEAGWRYQLLQVQLSRSVAIANLTRFSPLNPVTLVQIKLDK
ncbi:MAG: precorrin-6y C5,15-methyltransferase (decarboxylating) subunit CbiE [Microcoleaceae cyanobacterium]